MEVLLENDHLVNVSEVVDVTDYGERRVLSIKDDVVYGFRALEDGGVGGGGGMWSPY